MMNSAAVIGRQLRQQAVTGRTSGPIQSQIPFGKNRPRAPSHALIPPRPHSPIPPTTNNQSTVTNFPAFIDHNQVEPTVITFPVQSPSDRLNVTSKLTTGGSIINAVLAQREQRALANQLRKLDMQRKNPKLKCTLHCFCVAFKAMSIGLFLLIVGTIMSVYGFLLEAEQKQKAKLNNETVIPDSDELNRIRNFTYAGPVLCGLGIIAIIAASVLTFEVRDTLGVKEVVGERDGNILVEKKQKSNLAGVKKQTEMKEISNEDVTDTVKPQTDINDNENKQFSNQNLDNDYQLQNNQLSNLSSNPTTNSSNLPIQVCTIENELRKLSTSNTAITNLVNNKTTRVRTPPNSLELNKKDFDNNSGKVHNYKHSKHKLITKTRKNTALPLNFTSKKEQTTNNLQQQNKSDTILETNLDQLNQTNALKTEHVPVSDRHLSMSFSIDSTNLTTTDNQQIEQVYFGNLQSPQELDLNDLSEPSELYSLNLSSSINKTEKRKSTSSKTSENARCSCTASPDSDQDLDNNQNNLTTIKSNELKSCDLYRNQKDLNYHFVEQQKMQQQLIAQQQLLIEQQQKLTDFLQEKFINQQPKRQHSLNYYSTLTNRTLFEKRPSKISISLDQATPKNEKTISFELNKPSISLKSLPTTFEKAITARKSLSTSNHQLTKLDSSTKRIIESDINDDKKLSNQIKSSLKSRSTSSTLSNKSTNLSTKPQKCFRTSLSSQNLEFNINMLDSNKEKI